MYKETISELYNTYTPQGDMTLLTITDTTKHKTVVKIDTENAERVENLGGWSLRRGRSVRNYVGHVLSYGKHVFLHRYIMLAADHQVVKFNSDDRFDCRKSNLTLCDYRGDHRQGPHPYIYQYHKNGKFCNSWGVYVYDLTLRKPKHITTCPTLDSAIAAQLDYIEKNPHCKIGVPKGELAVVL